MVSAHLFANGLRIQNGSVKPHGPHEHVGPLILTRDAFVD